MRLLIVTGASRGLGHALAAAALARGDTVWGLARTGMDDLAGDRFRPFHLDLADAPAAAAVLTAALAAAPACTDACLINNAAVVEPVMPVQHLAAEAIAAAVSLNLATPMSLSAAFLRATAAWPARRKVLNVSSGAAHTAYEGWGVYCATKAGLDHFSRCLALEQAREAAPAAVVSLAPGVIDTDMQACLRAAATDDFPSRERFVALKATGQLQTPADTAQRLLTYLDSPDFGCDSVADLRHH